MAQVHKKRKITLKSDHVVKDIKLFTPLTLNQQKIKDEFDRGKNLLIIGSAGTGKTYTATALALSHLTRGDCKRIVFIRSTVPVRDMGFMPGTEDEKISHYERPYIATVNEISGRGDAYGIMKQKRLITFESTSFLRGSTFDDTIVIADEIENMSDPEINTIMTRLGQRSRIILCGDILQCDLKPKESGFKLLTDVIPHMKKRFSTIEMTHDDIVRSELVKEWIIAVEQHSTFYQTIRR